MKTLLITFILSSLFFLLPTTVLAQQSPEDLARKYQVSFPISELGGCQNFSECRTFCEDPVNSVACVQFAKQKGFYQEDPIVSKKDQIISQAKRDLGCNNEAECKAYCQIPTNYEKCEGFARQNSLIGGRVTLVQERQLIEKAKQSLGCDSPQSCASFCSNPDNQSQCSEFAKQTGLRGGEVKRGPGGCNSEDTCKAFCSDPLNYQECSKFGGGPQGFKGPGGCSSEDSCKSYCQQNPSSCRVISTDPYGGPGFIDNPQKAAEEFRKYCEASPDKCVNKSTNFFSDKDARIEFERFCSANPESCGAKTHFKQVEVERKGEGFVNPNDFCQKFPERCPNQKRFEDRLNNANSYDPAKMCAQAPNCRFESGSCRCSEFNSLNRPINNTGTFRVSPTPAAYTSPNSSGYSTPTSGGSTPSFNQVAAEQACKSAGGSWMGSYCQMPNTSGSGGSTTVNYSGGMSRESQEAGCRACSGTCNWQGDFCNCQCGSSGSTSTNTSTSQPTQPPQQPQSEQQPQPTSTPSVQGVSTKSFLQSILDFISGN